MRFYSAFESPSPALEHPEPEHDDGGYDPKQRQAKAILDSHPPVAFTADVLGNILVEVPLGEVAGHETIATPIGLSVTANTALVAAMPQTFTARHRERPMHRPLSKVSSIVHTLSLYP